jgi:hypothetical protein
MDGSGAEPAPADAGACQCMVDDTGTLMLSWDCYCAQSYVGCDVPLSVPADCAGYDRTDYADCGLTVLVDFTSVPGVDLPSVYDATGALVGRFSVSSASLYTCPSDPNDPNIWAYQEQAGRFPAPTCHGVACGGCYAGPFPCPPPDGGASDAGSPLIPDAARD